MGDVPNDEGNHPDQDTIYQMVDYLKAEMDYIDVFVIAFNGKEPKFTKATEYLMKLFGRMIGDQFWKNVVIAVTHYSFHEVYVNRRKNRGENESTWSFERTEAIRNMYNVGDNRFPVSFKKS